MSGKQSTSGKISAPTMGPSDAAACPVAWLAEMAAAATLVGNRQADKALKAHASGGVVGQEAAEEAAGHTDDRAAAAAALALCLEAQSAAGAAFQVAALHELIADIVCCAEDEAKRVQGLRAAERAVYSIASVLVSDPAMLDHWLPQRMNPHRKSEPRSPA